MDARRRCANLHGIARLAMRDRTLPEKLSTDRTLLRCRGDRPASVIGPQDPRAVGAHGRGAGDIDFKRVD